MHHIGTDIIEISRIEEAIGRWGESFLRRVYTDAELRLYQNHLPSLAARFAAKEAVIKALEKPKSGGGWKEIEVLSEPDGKPVVRLYGKARDKARRMGVDALAISLAHSKDYAIAFVIGETKANNHQ